MVLPKWRSKPYGNCDFTKTEIFDDSGRMIQAAIENTND